MVELGLEEGYSVVSVPRMIPVLVEGVTVVLVYVGRMIDDVVRLVVLLQA